MRKYGLIYILKPDLDEEAQGALQERVTSIIAGQDGTTEEVKVWGRRRLNYEIQDFREGVYVEVTFSGEAKVVQELDRIIKITDGFLRHIIVREDE